MSEHSIALARRTDGRVDSERAQPWEPATARTFAGARGRLRDRHSSHSPLTGRPNEPHMSCCHSLVSCLSQRNSTMNDYDPSNPHETVLARPVSSAMSASVPMAKHLRPRVRRFLSNTRSRWVMAAALTGAVVGLAACGTSPATTTSPSAPATGSGSGGGLGSGGGGSNTRSGPAAGGASGTVNSVSTSGFTLSTSAGQKVTVNEASSTTYQNGTSSTSASAITTGEGVLVLGTTSGTTITATQVIVQPTGGAGSTTSSAAGVIPFQRGAATTRWQPSQDRPPGAPRRPPQDRTAALPRSTSSAGPGRGSWLCGSPRPSQTRMRRPPRGRRRR